MEPYRINAANLLGRQIIIDMPSADGCKYISCNKENWNIAVMSEAFGGESDFLWNYEEGRKIIYSSYALRINRESPLNCDLSIPIWSIRPDPYVLLNNSPLVKAPEIRHTVAEGRRRIAIDDFYAEGIITCPSIIFSKSLDNGYSLIIKIYLDLAGQMITLWEKSIDLKSHDSEPRRAKYHGADHYFWDFDINEKWSVDIKRDLKISVRENDIVSLGISIRCVSDNETYIGEKEIPDVSFVRLKDFHYVLGLSEAGN